MSEIRWGIVGTGFIANKFAAAVKNVSTAKLVAVASRTKENGEAFAEKHGIDVVFSSYEDMAKTDMVDAVYIATPHPFHMPCALLFLNEKKHVLCEKPLCVNVAQAMKLKDCAQKNGVFLMEAMWTRFLPAIMEIEKVVNEGVIGEVLEITADFCYASAPDIEEKLFKNNMAGGSLLDVGVYGLHFASIFLGEEPSQICSISKIGYDVDLHMNILLKYENGAIANISSSIELSKPENAYIYGTKGHIKVPVFYGANEFFVYTNGEETHVKKAAIGDGFEEEIYEVCRCISENKTQSDILPIDKSIKILKQMDYIRKQNGIRYSFDENN